MKRTIAMILALVLAMSLTACGGFSGGEVQEPANVSTGDHAEDQQQGDQAETPEEPTEAEITISEAVLVDEAGVKITARSFVPDGYAGPEIKLLIENNSGKNLTFQCRYAAVNGYMVETILSVDVVNGKKANESLSLMNISLEACGIEAIADIEVSFHIFDTDGWENYLDTDAVQIKTSIADTFEHTYDDSGALAYEGNGVKIMVKGSKEATSVLGPGIVFYIVNTGDKDVIVQARDVSVNGFMVNSSSFCEIVAGKRAVSTLTFLKETLAENEITAIENVELSFYVLDMAGWDTIGRSGTVTITF